LGAVFAVGFDFFFFEDAEGFAGEVGAVDVGGVEDVAQFVAGEAVEAVAYRMILGMDGTAGIEAGVRLRYCDQIRLGRGSYLDEGVYIHATPGGVSIGPRTFVMHHAELHVYNFRGIPNAGIWIGADSLIGEFNVLRGQGGITIGDRVYFAPLVQVLAVNHVFDDPAKPFVEQGITAEGITIEDDVWVGAGAVVTDGVRIGRGAVIAAGSVVTEDVPPHHVAGGVPARVLREISEEGAAAAAERRAARGARVFDGRIGP
jgi:acetyltransferase-like isoleucine patch superfamily enzyme